MHLAEENPRASQPHNLAQCLEALALRQPHAPALVSSKYGQLSYAQLQAQIEHFRLRLHAAAWVLASVSA